MIRYYSTQRPILPGGFPDREKVEQIKNFDTKIFCEEIGEEAWGFVDYIEPLKKEQADAYELTLVGMKTYWFVTTSVYDDGRVIAAITNSIRAVKAPKNESKSLRRKDVYHDWFDSKEEADQFVEDAKNA